MWEYKICETDLGWIIFRRKYVGKILLLQYLNPNNQRTYNKSNARIFYNQDTAVSDLVIAKSKKEGEIEKPTEKQPEKQSWSELG